MKFRNIDSQLWDDLKEATERLIEIIEHGGAVGVCEIELKNARATLLRAKEADYESFPIKPNPSGLGYRPLALHEVIHEGDELYEALSDSWKPVPHYAIYLVHNDEMPPVRRPVP